MSAPFRWLAIITAMMAVAIAISTPVASLMFWSVMAIMGPARVTNMAPSERLYCWWEGFLRHWGQPGFTVPLVVTAAIPLVIVAMMGLSLAMRRGRRQLRPERPGEAIREPVRVASNQFGKARWMEVAEAAKLYPPCDPNIGGVPIVELYRVDQDKTVTRVPYNPKDRTTWGSAGTHPMVMDPLERGRNASGIIIGPPGFGKTSGFTIPALYQYRGSMVINDPSGEASKVTREWRKDMRHKVAILDPEMPELGAFNILNTIDITDKMASMAIKAFVTEASGNLKPGLTKDDNFFKSKGLSLNTALLADLLFDPDSEHTVREWRRRIVTPEREMKDRLRLIYAHSRSDYARDIVGELMDTYHETASGIRSHATGDTEWLSVAPLANLLSEETFDPYELIHGKMTCFMQFPSHLMNADPAIGRVVLGSLLRSVMRAEGRVATSVPFVIDETYQMKYMQSLAMARDEGRKFGIPLFTMWQSEAQIEEVFDRAGGKKAWFNTAAWRMYIGGVDDPKTAQELTTACGTYTVLAPTEGVSISRSGGSAGQTNRGTNEGFSLQAKKLVTEDDLRTGFRANEVLWLPKNQPSARFAVPAYYCRPDMAEDLQPNVFLAEYTKELTNA